MDGFRRFKRHPQKDHGSYLCVPILMRREFGEHAFHHDLGQGQRRANAHKLRPVGLPPHHAGLLVRFCIDVTILLLCAMTVRLAVGLRNR